MAPKPLILAVETSSRIGSVAIAIGDRILAETAFSGPMRHSAELFPAIHNLLDRFSRKPREIEHIYISVGPGSFTGLRIAVTTAKAMHLANPQRRTKIVAVDTLDVIAANADDYTDEKNTELDKIAAVLDAKRGQFFIALYQRSGTGFKPVKTRPRWPSHIPPSKGRDEPRATSDGIWKKTLPDSLMTAPQFLDKFAGSAQPVWLLGDGLVYYKDKFKADGIRFLDEKYWSPRAEKVHLLGWKKNLAGQFADALTLQPNYLRHPDVKTKT